MAMPHRLTLRPNGKIRPQRSKDYSMAINGLMTRRYRLISEAPETLSKDLQVIALSLQLLGFHDNPQLFMPNNRSKKRIFYKGQFELLIIGVLKETSEPISSRDICLAILPADFDLSDKNRINQVVTRVHRVLVREHDAGRVDRYRERPVMWRLCAASSP